MDDERLLDPLTSPLMTHALIRCPNKNCSVLVTGAQLKLTDGKCPYCKTQLAKPRKEKRRLPFDLEL